MDNDCDHVWINFPWYSMCVMCYEQYDGEWEWQEGDAFPEDIVIGDARVLAGGEPISAKTP